MARDQENRCRERRGTRLRPGKLVGAAGAVLCDCAIADRSADGARLRLFRQETLPALLWLFDERDGVRRDARLVWTRGREAGLAFLRPPVAVPAAERRRVAGRCYLAGR